MREMKIEEIDSGCYRITTSDFQDTDSVEYFWDTTSRRFYGEYQMATLEKRRFQREVFSFADYPTIGQAVDFIWRHDRELADARWRQLVNSRRTPAPRIVDRIDV